MFRFRFRFRFYWVRFRLVNFYRFGLLNLKWACVDGFSVLHRFVAFS